jgi:hypothetical protein
MCVVDLSDGGMGSIRFVDGPDDAAGRMGRELVTVGYTDKDEMPVSISLNVDDRGSLFEIDIWKVDFSPLLRYPRPADLRRLSSTAWQRPPWRVESSGLPVARRRHQTVHTQVSS